MSGFGPADRDTAYLLRAAVDEWPPQDHLADFVVEVIDQLDLSEMKCLKLGNIALDGTKIATDASKHRALSWEHSNKIEAQLRQEVQLPLKLAVDSDSRPLNDGMDVPAEIARREQRLGAIAQAKTKIEQRTRERQAAEQQEDEAKCAKRQAQREQGKKPRGPQPQLPSSQPKGSDQVNLTDEESRIMRCPSNFVFQRAALMQPQVADRHAG